MQHTDGCVFLQAETQEGPGGGADQEEDKKDTEVPARHRWCLPFWHSGQEEHEPRGQESPEGSGYQVSLLIFYCFILINDLLNQEYSYCFCCQFDTNL